jgi:hypothetical protein
MRHPLDPLLDDWTAQEPPRDFAERTVEAMLADAQEPRRRTLGKHWFGGLLLAAALVGTTAWATLGRQSQAEGPPAAVQRTNLRAPAAPTAPPPRQAAPAAEPEPAPPPPSSPPVVSAPPRTAVSAEPPTPPPFVPVPRCECQPGVMMCACLE